MGCQCVLLKDFAQGHITVPQNVLNQGPLETISGPPHTLMHRMVMYILMTFLSHMSVVSSCIKHDSFIEDANFHHNMPLHPYKDCTLLEHNDLRSFDLKN